MEGDWTEKRLFIIGWSDVSKSQACQMEESTKKHRLYHCSEWHGIRREIPEAFRKWEQKARTSKKEWTWQKGIVAHPLSESQWNRGHFSMKKSLRSTKAGACQQETSKATWPPMALFWERLESGELVVCSWTLMKRWALAWDVRLSGGGS